MRKNKNGRTVFARFYICKKTRAGKPGPYNPDKKDCKICRGGVSPPAEFPETPRGRTVFARFYICKKTRAGKPGPYNPDKKDCKICRGGVSPPAGFPETPRGRTLFARYYVCKKHGPGNPAPTILTKKTAKFVGAGSPRQRRLAANGVCPGVWSAPCSEPCRPAGPWFHPSARAARRNIRPCKSR